MPTRGAENIKTSRTKHFKIIWNDMKISKRKCLLASIWGCISGHFWQNIKYLNLARGPDFLHHLVTNFISLSLMLGRLVRLQRWALVPEWIWNYTRLLKIHHVGWVVWVEADIRSTDSCIWLRAYSKTFANEPTPYSWAKEVRTRLGMRGPVQPAYN